MGDSCQLYKFAERLLLADATFVWIKGCGEEAAARTDDKQLIAGRAKAHHCFLVFRQTKLGEGPL